MGKVNICAYEHKKLNILTFQMIFRSEGSQKMALSGRKEGRKEVPS